MSLRVGLVVALLAGVLSCSSARATSSQVPLPPGDPYPPPTAPSYAIQKISDVAYGSDPLQRMDIYRPVGAPDNAPVIFMVHGGGWYQGDKALPNVVENKVAHWVPLGYALVSVNYRLVPQVHPLEQAGDVANALSYAQSHAAQWGLDPSRFVLMGHSAGGHLVALLNASPAIAASALAQPWLGTVDLDSAAYNVVQAMSGPHPSLFDDAFGDDPAYWFAASPYQQLSAATEPMLLVCSTQRNESCPQVNAFAQKDDAFGAYVDVLPIDDSHGDINATVGLNNDLTIEIDAFLQALGFPAYGPPGPVMQ